MPFLSPNQQCQGTEGKESPSHYQWYIFIDKQWFQLPEFIPSNSNSGLHSCISIFVYTQRHLNNKTYPLTSDFTLSPLSTLVCPVPVTGFMHPLHNCQLFDKLIFDNIPQLGQLFSSYHCLSFLIGMCFFQQSNQCYILQCFDAIGWAAGRAFNL